MEVTSHVDVHFVDDSEAGWEGNRGEGREASIVGHSCYHCIARLVFIVHCERLPTS